MDMPAFALLPSMSAGSLVLLLIITILYFGLIGFLSYRYVKSFDNGFKVITAAAAVYLAVLAGWRFLDERHREVARSFAEKQLALCLDATEAAATIAASYNHVFGISDHELHKSSRRFQELYYGSLATVEDDDVANAMIEFQEIAHKEGWGNSNHNEDNLETKQRLDCEIINLADACRKMIQSNWEIRILSPSTTTKLKASTAPPDSKVRCREKKSNE
jgi:hypothetical protein